MSQKVAIFGASGAQGAPVVERALAQGMTARDAREVAAMHPNAEAVSADLSSVAAVNAALRDVDAAFVHLPMPMGPDDAQKWLGTLIEAAHQVTLPLLVFTTSAPSGLRYPSAITTDGATAVITTLQASGIPTIILQPAIYLENLQPEMFLPRLRREGVLDYPPLPVNQKVMWTSHKDQAKIAVAALARPDLAGNSYEIGTPNALTGGELAELLAGWLGRPVMFDPLTPAEFGQRIGDALNSPGAGFALTDQYGALAKMESNGMAVDTSALEATFGITLTSVAEHIKSWGKDAK